MEYEIQVRFRMEADGAGEEIIVGASRGDSLLDVAKRGDIPIDAPCGGNGTCGKCRVQLLLGALQTEENKHLPPAEFQQGWRLACVSRIQADAEILVPASALAYQSRIRVADFGGTDFEGWRETLAALGFEPVTNLREVALPLKPPDIDDPMADWERLSSALKTAVAASGTDAPPRCSLPALRQLPEVLRASDFSVHCLLRRDGAGQGADLILEITKEGTRQLGLAVDIGTTTVSALLMDLRTGKLLAAGSAGNGQIRFGADVIHRLIESAKPEGLSRLRAAVTEQCMQPLIARLCERAGVASTSICRAAIAGNTTMVHLFTGVYANHLRMEPYVPAFFALDELRGADVEIGIHPDAEVLLAPAVGSYVGGDITAGLLATGIHRKPGISLFVDLGTNGELVLGGADFLMTCACSAGPAFEGGDIRCGMRATDGAIESCLIDAESMEPTVKLIGEAGQKPVGICGSGLIDCVGELFRCGIINAKGKFIRQGERIQTDEWGISRYLLVGGQETATGKEIIIDDADIDNFIRAKASIYSAIRTLLQMTDMEAEMVEEVCVAGGIGSGINIESAIRIGMFPAIGAERYRYVGNSALLGAYAMAWSPGAAEEVRAIAKGMTYIELSTWPAYMDEFIAACFLPHTDASLFSEGEGA